MLRNLLKMFRQLGGKEEGITESAAEASTLVPGQAQVDPQLLGRAAVGVLRQGRAILLVKVVTIRSRIRMPLF